MPNRYWDGVFLWVLENYRGGPLETLYETKEDVDTSPRTYRQGERPREESKTERRQNKLARFARGTTLSAESSST